MADPIKPGKIEAKPAIEPETKEPTEKEMTDVVTAAGWEPVKDAPVPTFINTVAFDHKELKGSRQTSHVGAGIVRKLKDAFELEKLRPKK